jgi:MFS family permease
LVVVQEWVRPFFTFEGEEVIDDSDEPPTRQGTILQSPGVLVCEIIVAVLMALLMGNMVYMQFHLEQNYHEPSWAYSIQIVGYTLILGVSLGLAPVLEDALGVYPTTLAGIIIMSVAYLFMGPSPWLGISPTTGMWLPLLGWGFGALGFGLPFAIFTALPTNIAIAAGWSESDASIQIAACQTVVMGAGVSAGPVIMEALADNFGEDGASSYLFVGVLGIVGLLWLILACLNPPVAKPEPEKTLTEDSGATSETVEKGAKGAGSVAS